MTALAIAAPDWRRAVQVHLTGQLSVPVSSDIPEPRPAEFVTLMATGGPGRAGVVQYGTTVMFRGWGQSEPAAWDVANAARSALLALDEVTVGGVQFYRVREVGALVPMPDPVSSQQRWQGTIQMYVREVADG